jgi:ribonuclease P protein component
MKRRNRLSRSRDFDVVYRHGRSVSTRYLVLYTFPRQDDDAGTEPRVGLAISRRVGGAVERNRIKRRLREVLERLRDELEPSDDYVLIVRPGLPEAAEARGLPWLEDRVREVFGQARESGAKRG